ncbi:unnamed protein product [Linum trigynum]|uniref:Uncharacterized protein n=1 Tax=Linum trigynum TaxID=586398 RepID=A0AAV2DUN0_9ROSI
MPCHPYCSPEVLKWVSEVVYLQTQENREFFNGTFETLVLDCNFQFSNPSSIPAIVDVAAGTHDLVYSLILP